MFIDETQITVQAGRGGNGAATFFPGVKNGPSGGNGGNGASIYIKGDKNMIDLYPFARKRIYKAPPGKPGANFQKNGENGMDLVLSVPVGTLCEIKEVEQNVDVTDTTTLHLLASGGQGGLGNVSFKSSTNQAPRYAEEGKPGQERTIKLILKLIADIGLIGLPNAGKSSLLNVMTKASARVGAYPFTTISPNLGVIEKKILADIPGLIEGASSGRGLGIKFLKHIEKVRVLIHCISSESEDPAHDYNTIMGEMEKYNSSLPSKKQIVLLTKSDLTDKSVVANKIKLLSKCTKDVYTFSVYNEKEIDVVRNLILNA